MKSMKIGQLAKSTNITIRTLHHYDEIGLLKPSRRDDSGHRVYIEGDITRLHRIIALRKLGLPLDDIQKIIGESFAHIQEFLDRQIEKIECEITERQKTLRRLKGSSDYMNLKENVDVNDLVETIKELSIQESYYSESELEELRAREDEIGNEKIKEIMEEWPALIEKVREAMTKGVGPKNKEIQKIALRWLDVKELFSGGNNQLALNAKKLYQEHPNLLKRHGMSVELLDFVQKAADLARGWEKE